MRKSGLLALFVLVVFAARGEWLSEAVVRRAAAVFPTRSAVGSAALPGRQLASLEARGRLWVARYSPTGYAVFAGSDLAGPVIAFAATDFAEPAAGSAFFDVLAGASAGCERAEAAGESENGLRIRAKWAKLASSRPVLRAAEAGSGTVTAEPFLATFWDQCQPFNDYAPVYTTGDDTPLRGRVPCGCVATAAAQVFAYWRWPARIDAVRTYDHDFTKANGTVGTYTIRFDGHVPLDWESLEVVYPFYNETNYNETNYELDMRGAVAESTRYPVARLVSLCDSLAQMDFAPDASGSNYDTLIANSPWYEGGTKYSTSSDRAAAKAAAKADIEAGIPVLVSIPGHAVVGHGWMEEDDTSYIYFNYGWGGENDGYYNFDDQGSENAVMAVYTGFRPRFTAQLDPLPAVLPSSTTLRWHVPDCWTNSIEGFAVTVQTVYPSEIETSPDASAWLSGVSSSDGMRIDGQSRLAIATLAVGTYTMSGVYLLTARSELTFGVASSYALGMCVTVEASFDGGPWTVVSTPSLSENGESGRSVCRAYLGEHGGQMARFRVRAARTSSQFYPMDFAGVWLDSLCVSGTCRKASSTVVVHDANARSFELGAFTGCGVVVSVTPVGTGAEMSDFVTAWGEGESLVPDPGQETYVATGGGGSEPVLPEATFSSVTRTACAAP